MAGLREFFARYEAAFSMSATRVVAEDYPLTLIMSSPESTTCYENNDQFRSVLSQAADFYEGIGMKVAKITSYTNSI